MGYSGGYLEFRLSQTGTVRSFRLARAVPGRVGSKSAGEVGAALLPCGRGPDVRPGQHPFANHTSHWQMGFGSHHEVRPELSVRARAGRANSSGGLVSGRYVRGSQCIHHAVTQLGVLVRGSGNSPQSSGRGMDLKLDPLYRPIINPI